MEPSPRQIGWRTRPMTAQSSSKPGRRIQWTPSGLSVPDDPIIPYIEGDGIGKDVMTAARRVLDAAVEKAYGGKRRLVWQEVLAGEKAHAELGEWLPEETLRAIKDYAAAIKGPLTTPIGGGFRSLNVTLRQKLDLYAAVRPVRYFSGLPSPLEHPERTDMVIFRENTEDVYAGFEWPADSAEAKELIAHLNTKYGTSIREGSGIGIKPMSPFGTKRLVRAALRYALAHHRPVVTLVHKGNIMKYTEGAFRDWGYEVATTEFRDHVVTEQELGRSGKTQPPEGKILVNDRVADNMFQQILTRTQDYSVLATPNLNGDYLSDALAAQVGGLGIAPGANIGDRVAVFEATHGTAPKYANLDKANPGSLILSGVMMLEHLGWNESAQTVTEAFGKTILQKRVTPDLARQLGDVEPLGTSGFASAIIENL